MLVEFTLPAIVPQMTTAVVECVYAEVGAPLKLGHKLLDLSVDLGGSFAQDCPPISFFRIVLRESLWLRRLDVVPGQSCPLGELLAVFSSDATESLDQPPQRALRTTVAGIVHHIGMWTGNLA